MTKNVSFSSTTAIFYTYTLEEYPGRIPDPTLPISFNDATELLQLRSIFRKATEQLEAVRAKLEAEQVQHGSIVSSSMDSSPTETQDSPATSTESFESNSSESDKGDVLCRTRNLEDFDDTSMKHKVEFVHGVAQPASVLTTPPASPLSPSRENVQVPKNMESSPPSKAEPSSCAALSIHPSPPASPVPSTPHSRSPTGLRFSTAPRSEPSEQLQPQHCISNHPSGRILPDLLSPTANSLIRKAATPAPPISSPSSIYPNPKILSESTSCFLQEYQSITQDPTTSQSSCEDMRVKRTRALGW